MSRRNDRVDGGWMEEWIAEWLVWLECMAGRCGEK